MGTNFRHESAKIYEFPRRGTAAGGPTRRDGGAAPVVRLQRYPDVECGSAWYHEAAVQEATRTHKP